MYMYICIYVYIYICVYMCICVYAYMCVCIYINMHVCMHAIMHVWMYACVQVCMHACMYICVHLYMYVCMYVCVIIHISIYIYITWDIAFFYLCSAHTFQIYIYIHYIPHSLDDSSPAGTIRNPANLDHHHLPWYISLYNSNPKLNILNDWRVSGIHPSNLSINHLPFKHIFETTAAEIKQL